MFWLIFMVLLKLRSNCVSSQCDSITAALLEEVLAIKNELNDVKLELQELQLTSTSCTCDDSTSTSDNGNFGSNGTAFGQLKYSGGDTVLANTWSTIVWDTISHNKNLIYNNDTGIIKFPFIGSYLITISFADYDAVSSAAFRLYGVVSGEIYGLSSRIIVTGDANTYDSFAVTFIATIDDLDEPYSIQFAGYTSIILDLGVTTIGGVNIPYVLAVVQYFGK